MYILTQELKDCENTGFNYGGCIFSEVPMPGPLLSLPCPVRELFSARVSQEKQLVITRSTLDGCRSGRHGGAAAGGGEMYVINSTIINSFARFEGGAFYSYRAPVIIAGSHLENCSSGWVSGALGSEGTEPT